MSSLAVWRERWLDTFRHQRVEMWSPHSVDESLWRLRRVTTKSVRRRYLDRHFGGQRTRGPVLFGRVGDIRLGATAEPELPLTP
jgi:hypothetical protein